MAGEAEPEPKRKRKRRKQVPFEITPAAVAGLDALAFRHHTTRVVLVEALGIVSADHDPTLAEIIEYAQELDRTRRSRQPGR